MATSFIDGTIEEARLKRSFANMRVLDPVNIRLADGSVEQLGKRIVEGNLATYIEPGASGRFYLYRAIDHSGIHGVRLAGGEEAYGFARNNEIASILCAVFGAVLLAIYLSTGTMITSWMWVLLIIGVPGFFIYWSSRREAERQFDADGDYRPPAAVPSPAV